MPPALPVQRPERRGRLCRARHDHLREDGAEDTFFQGHRRGLMMLHHLEVLAQAE
jgi:hypothetical protein